MLEVIAKAVSNICDAGNKQELQAAIYNAVRSLGFDSFNLAFEKRAKREFMTDPTLTNWAYEDLVAYESDGWSEKDPLLEYAATGTGPLCWQSPDWERRREPGYYEYLKFAGIFGGLTIPLPGSLETLGALTLLSFSSREHDSDVLHAASIIAVVAKSRAAAIGLISGQASGSRIKFRSLSSLQREILKWMAGGKSNVEIALIVGQSKRSVDYHVIEILKKLEVGSRAQAAAIYASI